MAALDWPGLLQWSTKYHDGTAPTQFKMMNDEDKAFLQEAMEQAFSQIEDLNKVLQEGLQKVDEEMKKDTIAEDAKDTKADPLVMITSLEMIDRCIDDPDCARNLELFDGIRILLSGVLSAYKDVSDRCCEILTLMLANNEKLQLAAVEKHKALDILVLSEENSKTVSEKRRFSLLGSIVRGVTALENTFCKEPYNGIRWMAETVFLNKDTPKDVDVDESQKIQEKAFLFLKHLILSDSTRVQGSEKALVDAMVTAYDMLNSKADQREFDMQFLENLAECTIEIVRVVKGTAPMESLKEKVSKRVALLSTKDREDVMVEQDICKEVLNIIG